MSRYTALSITEVGHTIGGQWHHTIGAHVKLCGCMYQASVKTTRVKGPTADLKS